MKFSKRLFIISVILLLATVAWLHFETVDFDSGACSGGFKKSISEKYANELGDIFLKSQRIDSSVHIIGKEQIQRLTENMTWRGRIIKTKCRIALNGVKYDVEYQGERYWIERYKWHILRVCEVSGPE